MILLIHSSPTPEPMMASSSSYLGIPFFSIRSLHHREPLFRPTTNLPLPFRNSPSSSILTFARRRRSSTPSGITPKKKTKEVEEAGVEENDELDEDAFEALFKLLEEDLKNDELSLDDDDFDDISEDDLKKLEQELEEALNDDELLAAFGSNVESQVEKETELDEEDEEDEDNKEPEDKQEEHSRDGNDEGVNEPQLKTWQLRRLAQAMKKGRRKISIKNLAADLCLDRAIVLNLLREPPPSLLMLSAALPDEPDTPTIEAASEATEPVIADVESTPLEEAGDDTKLVETENVPVHVKQRNWSAQKRLKKAQLETLESVYGKTKRPTNTMISSIVHVTNLPRKKVVKWFEDKRSEEGVPSYRVPYQPSEAETANIQ